MPFSLIIFALRYAMLFASADFRRRYRRLSPAYAAAMLAATFACCRHFDMLFSCFRR